MSNPSPTWLGSIWIAPRTTMRRVLEHGANRYVLTLTMLGGTWSALDRAADAGAGELVPLFVLLAVVAVVGPMVALVKLFVAGWLVSWIGRWFGGAGRAREIRAALAWGSTPVVAAGAIWLVLLPLFGERLFTDEAVFTPALLWAIFGGLVITVLWSAVTTIKCVAEAHRFSAWRATANLFVTWLVVGLVWVVPFLAIVTVATLSDWLG